jgi:hypothetical protein
VLPNTTIASLPTIQVSPDGRNLLVLSTMRGQPCPSGAGARAASNLYTIRLDTGTVKQVIPAEVGRAVAGTRYDMAIFGGFWSPQGDLVLAGFSASECLTPDSRDGAEGRHREIIQGTYLVRSDSGGELKVSDELAAS